MVAGEACPAKDRPIVGAIRWDAWTGGGVTEQVECTLSPKKYQDRLPWFAKVVDDQTATIDGSPQAVMDQEIEYAAQAGLDYWAFLVYAQDHSMSAALCQYLRSRKRAQVHFCLILHSTLKLPDERWPAERDRIIALLRAPGYQTVLGNRPLLYAFTGQDFPFARFRELLAATREAGLNPYCVYMGWRPAKDYARVKPDGFDAVSAYAKSGDQPRFIDLAKSVEEEYWASAAKAKVPYVPLVTTGWEKSPRKDNPVRWEVGQGYHKQKVFPAKATPAEIAAHLGNALTFVKQHADLCPAQAVIIYAWNEYDEGGWIAPTRSPDGTPDTSRLGAIRRVLEPGSKE